jgi:hypothetical protein
MLQGHGHIRFYWIKDRLHQGQLIVHWQRGTDNLADYFTKHPHSPAHHRLMRSRYLLELHIPVFLDAEARLHLVYDVIQHTLPHMRRGPIGAPVDL